MLIKAPTIDTNCRNRKYSAHKLRPLTGSKRSFECTECDFIVIFSTEGIKSHGSKVKKSKEYFNNARK